MYLSLILAFSSLLRLFYFLICCYSNGLLYISFFYWKLYICSWHLFHILCEHYFFLQRLNLLSLKYCLCFWKHTDSSPAFLLFVYWKHFLLLIIWWNHILFYIITFLVISLESLIAFTNHSNSSLLCNSYYASLLSVLHPYIYIFHFNTTTICLITSTVFGPTIIWLWRHHFSTPCYFSFSSTEFHCIAFTSVQTPCYCHIYIPTSMEQNTSDEELSPPLKYFALGSSNWAESLSHFVAFTLDFCIKKTFCTSAKCLTNAFSAQPLCICEVKFFHLEALIHTVGQ